MIAQNTVMAVLIGIVITGVIPVLGGIILLAMGKIKGSSFWAGVLAYIIAMIVYAIASGIYAASTMDLNNLASVTTEISAIAIIVMSLLLSVFMALSMGICIAGCMKLRTFQAAVSCGLGFAVSFTLTNAIGLVSIYFQFVQINSGAFDNTYRAAIENGFMTKEDFNLLKSQIINTPMSDIVLSTVNSVISALLYVAIAIFIMRGVCSKNTFTGIAASALVMAASSLPSALDNIYIAIALGSVISIAAFAFSLSMKNKIVPPPKPMAMVQDPFLQAVETSRQSDGQNDGQSEEQPDTQEQDQ